jgi:hypothetical protein
MSPVRIDHTGLRGRQAGRNSDPAERLREWSVARYAFRGIHPERPIVERAFGDGSVFAFRTRSHQQLAAHLAAAGKNV